MSTPTTTFWVKKHPTAAVLATALINLPAETAPGEYEQMTEPALEAWKAAEIAAGWVPVPEPQAETPVPWAISNADFRDGLIDRGINPALVTAYISSLPDGPAKWRALNAWEQTNYVERDHAMVNDPVMLQAFGMDGEDMNTLFRSKPAYPLL